MSKHKNKKKDNQISKETEDRNLNELIVNNKRKIEFFSICLAISGTILSILNIVMCGVYSMSAESYYHIPGKYFLNLQYSDLIYFLFNLIFSISIFLYIGYYYQKDENNEKIINKKLKLSEKIQNIGENFIKILLSFVIIFIFLLSLLYSLIKISYTFKLDITLPDQYIWMIIFVVVCPLLLGLTQYNNKIKIINILGMIVTILNICFVLIMSFLFLISPEYNREYEIIEVEIDTVETSKNLKNICENTSDKESESSKEVTTIDSDIKTKNMLILSEYNDKFLVTDFCVDEQKKEQKKKFKILTKNGYKLINKEGGSIREINLKDYDIEIPRK